MIKYIFIGGTYRGFQVLSGFISRGYIPRYAIVLKEDKHEVLNYSKNIISLLSENEIPYDFKKKLDKKNYQYIGNHRFDFGICCGWRTIIEINKIKKNFKIGIVAAHDSLLPKYRGFAPMNWAIINGEEETGVTLFKLNNRGVDSGDIFAQIKVKIGPDDYAIDVYKKITTATVELYLRFLKSYQKRKIKFFRQNEELATYTCKRIPSDGRIDWNKSSREILNLIRALAHPYPGAFCYFGKRVYHIRKAKFGSNYEKKYVGRIPGRLININRQGIEVLCGRGSLLIEKWEDKKKRRVENPFSSIKKISATVR